jgi:hypothetical protein
MASTAPQRKLLLGTENADGTVTGVTGTVTSPWVQADASGLITVYFRSVGVTSGGTVLIEEADWGPLEPPYAGTWSTVQSQAASTFTGTVQLAVHVTLSAFAYWRVRISSAITGGGAVLVSARTMGPS